MCDKKECTCWGEDACNTNKPVDWTKPVQFKNCGDKIINHFHSKDGRRFIIAINDLTEDYYSVTVNCDGSYNDESNIYRIAKFHQIDWDVINVPPKKLKVYMVLYHDGSTAGYTLESLAKEAVKNDFNTLYKRYYVGTVEFDDPR